LAYDRDNLVTNAMAGDNSSDDEGSKKLVSKSINFDNPSSPYYLCISDNPSNIISPIILYDENYAN